MKALVFLYSAIANLVIVAIMRSGSIFNNYMFIDLYK